MATESRTSYTSDPNRLAPEDAFGYSPPRQRSAHKTTSAASSVNGKASSLSVPGVRKGAGSSASRQRRSRGRSRSSRRGESRQWKKLLWVKQPYPDNYTDASSFLSHLQRGPGQQVYDFWPLVADSTVIVQHICAVALFVSCFVGIYQEHVSPISVVGTATAFSFMGWIMWDIWLGIDEKEKQLALQQSNDNSHGHGIDTDGIGHSALPSMAHSTVTTPGLGISSPNSHAPGSTTPSLIHSRNQSSTSLATMNSVVGLGVSHTPASSFHLPPHPPQPPNIPSGGWIPTRNQQRLATGKSALLICLSLLGLSPILKSLTQSTSSDSIWAMSCWLMLVNIFTFDYGGLDSPSSRFPASLSTNAAVMASTVLASRLPTTMHVFSLTLFSIEVFGLFPVFRRHLRHRSFVLHAILTVLLILSSGAGLGMMIISGGTIKAGLLGIVTWGLGTMVIMGGCSWWLIGLQRYKDVVIGPWDPARPIIRAAGNWE